MKINWKEFSDVQLFLILTSLEQAETWKNPRAFKSTIREYNRMRKNAEKEYRRRRLHWEMFESDE